MTRPGVWQLDVEFRPDGTLQISRMSREGRVTGSRLDDVWTAFGPSLPDAALAVGVPNDQALSAACRGNGRAAARHAGSAFGRAVARIATPPKDAQRGALLARWAWASAARRRGDCRSALPILRRTVQALERNRLGPIWRRARPSGRVPSAIVADDSVVILFEEGDFLALNQGNGETIWRNTGGPAEPRPVITGDGGVLLIRERALIELDIRTGRVRWQRAMLEPHPEVVVARNVVFAADRDRLFALSREDGRPQWIFDGLAHIAGGPVAVGAYLALPVEHRLVVLHRSGDRVFEVDLSDEISAPLVVAGGHRVWALVGSDEAGLVDLNRRSVVFRTDQLPGVAWPPAVLGRTLAVAVGGRHPKVGFVDPEQGSHLRASISAPPAVGAFPDASGVVHPISRGRLLKRSATGSIRWRTNLPSPLHSFEVVGDSVVAAAHRTVAVLDGLSGRILERVDFESPVIGVARPPFGGAALLREGTVYGLAGAQDPRRSHWLTEARRELAHCFVAQGDRTRARQLADQLLARDPDDIEARIVKARAVTTPPAQFSAWWELAVRLPPTDPLAAEAHTGLARAGVLATVEIASEVLAMVGTSSGALVLQLPSGVEARPALEPHRILWARTGGKLGGRSGPNVQIDGAWVSSWTGDPVILERAPAVRSAVRPAHGLATGGIQENGAIESTGYPTAPPPGPVRTGAPSEPGRAQPGTVGPAWRPDVIGPILDRRLNRRVRVRARVPDRLAVVLSKRYLVLLEP